MRKLSEFESLNDIPFNEDIEVDINLTIIESDQLIEKLTRKAMELGGQCRFGKGYPDRPTFFLSVPVGNIPKVEEPDDFKTRLLNEREELLQKIEKLQEFLNSEEAKSIAAAQLAMLNIQIHAMLTYSQCLKERIIRL